jgi:hypothetical protein
MMVVEGVDEQNNVQQRGEMAASTHLAKWQHAAH